ncbi:MAG TPA: hypothetical protein VFP93_03675 [Gammaproteobacteria bacterium]|nr:hypothetical protein [Gammaproteobacteria bacterium]
MRYAINVGLKIPNTLISNDPKEIINFIDSNNKNNANTVYKIFKPVIWEEENKKYNFYTTTIERKALEGDYFLTPGIFQNYVKKAFEVRVTFFGSKYIAIKINNSETIDWRKIKFSDIRVEQFVLPTEIFFKCQLLMKKLGIIFGCFDFVVTRDNEFYFLEVNEMGQFLWIDELLPELNLLDTFCNFMIDSQVKPLQPQIA